MAAFKMQERDLDLFILEEFFSTSDFSKWFGEQIGLTGFVFQNAEHSVSAKIDAKWGETDILAFFSKGSETVAVLIEDKIAAQFADRQAERYHERANELVKDNRAHRCVTVLVAPQIYLENVPKTEPWDKRLSMDDLRDWFARTGTPHDNWRKSALDDCLARVTRSAKAGREDVLRLSEQFASFLQTQPGLFNHKPTDDKWGFIVTFTGRLSNVQLTWKASRSRVDLTLFGPHLGKARHTPIPAGISCEFADGTLKSDMLAISVPEVDFASPLEAQADVQIAVMSALYELVLLAQLILQDSSVSNPT